MHVQATQVPCHLSSLVESAIIELQDRKGCKVCKKIMCNNLITIATLKNLKLRNFADKAKNVVINNALTRKDKLSNVNIADLKCK